MNKWYTLGCDAVQFTDVSKVTCFLLVACSFYPSTLNKEAMLSSETSANFYRSKGCHIREENIVSGTSGFRYLPDGFFSKKQQAAVLVTRMKTLDSLVYACGTLVWTATRWICPPYGRFDLILTDHSWCIIQALLSRDLYVVVHFLFLYLCRPSFFRLFTTHSALVLCPNYETATVDQDSNLRHTANREMCLEIRKRALAFVVMYLTI